MSLEELAGAAHRLQPVHRPAPDRQDARAERRAGLGTVMGVPADPSGCASCSGLPRITATRHFCPSRTPSAAPGPSCPRRSPSRSPGISTWSSAARRMAARESAIAGYAGILGPVADHSCTNRNGRSMETKGESPWLTARYVERIVRGFQGASLERPGHCRGHAQALDRLPVRRRRHRLPRRRHLGARAARDPRAAVRGRVPGRRGDVHAGLHPALRHADAHERARQRPPARLLGGAHAVSIGDHTADVELIEHGVAGDMCDAALKAFEGGLHISLQGGTYLPCLPDLVARWPPRARRRGSAGGRGPAA